MKKIGFLLLSVCFAFCLCLHINAQALPKLTICDTLFSEGQTITVSVIAENFDSVYGGSIEIAYDNASVALIEINSGGAVSNASLVKNKVFSEKSFKVSWASISKPQQSSNELLSLEFEIVKNNSSDIKFATVRLFDINGCSVEFETVDGKLIFDKPKNNPNKDVYLPNFIVPSDNSSNTENEENEPEQEQSNSSLTDSKQQTTQTETTVQSKPEQEKRMEFFDVPQDKWFYNSVEFMYSRGYMQGMGEKEFAPDYPLTRAMLVTIIYRIAGSQEVEAQSSFDDVENDMWYTDAVNWAKNNDIVSGIGNNMFAPDDFITREQLCVIMYNYSKLSEMAGEKQSFDLGVFSDMDNISSWATDAVEWACSKQIIKGRDNGTVDPSGNATRAEASAVLQRYLS